MTKAEYLTAFDSNGFSDPYVTIRINGKSREKTPTKNKTLNPVWNYVMPATTLSVGDCIEFRVSDYDVAVSDDYMGRCFVNVDA